MRRLTPTLLVAALGWAGCAGQGLGPEAAGGSTLAVSAGRWNIERDDIAALFELAAQGQLMGCDETVCPVDVERIFAAQRTVGAY